MIVRHIAMRMFARPRDRQKRENAHLTIWLLVLGITLTSLLTLFVQPAQAKTFAMTQQTSVHKTAAYTNPTKPMKPKDGCNDANCYAGTGANGTNGQVKNPIGDNPLMFFTQPNLTVGQPAVVTLWQGGLAIADAAAVVLIMLNGIRIMVSGSIFRYADVVETLPRVLVSLIAANVSLVLIGIMLGLNNSLSTAFLSFAQHVTIGNLPDDVSFGSIFSDLIKSIGAGAAAAGATSVALNITSSLASAIPVVGGILSKALGTAGSAASSPAGMGVMFAIAMLTQLPRILLQMVALIMTVMLFAQLIVRILLIDFYIVIAAPCIACSGLPGRSGQPVTNFWLKGIITTIMAQALQVVGIIVSEILFNGIFALIDNKLPGFINNNLLSNVNLAQLVVYIAMLWFIIRLPTLFSLNPSTQMIAAGGQLAAGAASQVAGAVGGGIATAVSLGGAGLLAARSRAGGTP